MTTIIETAGYKKIGDLIFNAIMATCGQVQDAWGVTTKEEKERIEKFAQDRAAAAESNIGGMLQAMVDEYDARDRPYFNGTEKGIAIKEGIVTIQLTTSREDAPDDLFTHRAGFLVILTERQYTLDELHKQRDLFDGSGATPAGQLASELREELGGEQQQIADGGQGVGPTTIGDAFDTFNDWRDRFFILALQIGATDEWLAVYQKEPDLEILLKAFEARTDPGETLNAETTRRAVTRVDEPAPEQPTKSQRKRRAAQKADTPETPAPIDPASDAGRLLDWTGDFLTCLISVDMDDAELAKYDTGGPLAVLAADYWSYKWTPMEAAQNEIKNQDRRPISDGPLGDRDSG